MLHIVHLVSVRIFNRYDFDFFYPRHIPTYATVHARALMLFLSF
jgi:hypothetical protein